MVPEDKREGLVLHTSDIYGGNGPVFDKDRFREWTWERRSEILMALAKLPEKWNLHVTFGYTERADFPHFPGYQPIKNLDVDAHIAAYVNCLMEVDLWFRQNRKSENCMVIAQHPLILADFIAFTMKRKLMKDPRIDPFCAPWWKRLAALAVHLHQ